MKIEISDKNIQKLNQMIDFRNRTREIYRNILPEYEDAKDIRLDERADKIIDVEKSVDEFYDKIIPNILHVIISGDKNKPEEIEKSIEARYESILSTEKNLYELTCYFRIKEIDDFWQNSGDRNADVYERIRKLEKKKLKLDGTKFNDFDTLHKKYKKVIDDCQEIEFKLIGLEEEHKKTRSSKISYLIYAALLSIIVGLIVVIFQGWI